MLQYQTEMCVTLAVPHIHSDAGALGDLIYTVFTTLI